MPSTACTCIGSLHRSWNAPVEWRVIVNDPECPRHVLDRAAPPAEV